MFSSLFQRKPSPTERFSFTHQGRVLNVTLRRRRNAKRLTMRVRDGHLALTTPLDVSAQDARHFIINHYDWVDSRLTAEERDLNISPDTDTPSGTPSIWYKGVLTPVYLFRDPAHHGRAHIRHHDDGIVITMAGAPKTGLSAASRQTNLRPAALLENWLKAEAKSVIKSTLDDVLPMIDQAPVPLSIRDQKTRWGSCSTTRRLSFNWRLIMAPPAALHYVVVHEAVHLIHHDHSSRFWGKVAEMMPDYHHHKDWLNTHQQDLFANLDRRLHGLKPQYSLN